MKHYDLTIIYKKNGSNETLKFPTIMDFMDAMEKNPDTMSPPDTLAKQAVFFENPHNTKTDITLAELLKHCQLITH